MGFTSIMYFIFRARTRRDSYVSLVNSKVTVKLDKNVQLVDNPEKRTIKYNVKVPVGTSKTKLFQLQVSSGTLSSSTTSLRMSAEVEQIKEKTQKFCKECGQVGEPHKFTADLPFQTGCLESICKSDLGLDVFMKDMESEPGYVIGSTSKLVLGVIVNNKINGEPAYKPTISIVYPFKLKLSQSIANCNEKNEGPDRTERRLVCGVNGPIFPGDLSK